MGVGGYVALVLVFIEVMLIAFFLLGKRKMPKGSVITVRPNCIFSRVLLDGWAGDGNEYRRSRHN
jgi:hypothetical protein